MYCKPWSKNMHGRILVLYELTNQQAMWAVTHNARRWHCRNIMSVCKRESWQLAGWQIKAPCLYPICLQLLLLFASSISDLFQGSGSDPADTVTAETIWFFLLSVSKSHFVVDSILNKLTKLRPEFPESRHLIWGTHCLWTRSDYLRHWLQEMMKGISL